MTVFYITILLGALSLTGSLLVIIRAGNKPENRVFFIVGLLSAIWSITFASIELPSNLSTVILLNKLAFFAGILLLLAATAFTYYFPIRLKNKSLVIYSLCVLPVALLSFTELIAGTVSVGQDGAYVFEFGELTLLYILVFLIGVFLIIRNSLQTRKKVSAIARTQLEFVMFGYSLSLIAGVSLALLVPLIWPASNLDDLAPASLTILILIVSYAIIKHQLFDFRGTLFRASSYFFITAFVSVLYVVSAFLLKRVVFPDLQLSTSQLVSNIVLAVLLVSTYPIVKSYFDKITVKIFYQDSYDPQQFIDRLNQTLVTNVNLEELLTKCALIIQEELKTTFCTFYIRETSYFEDRIIGAHRQKPEFKNLKEYKKLTSKIRTKVFSVEEVHSNDIEKELSHYLKEDDVEVLTRLTNTLDYEVNGIGYIFIGPKKSGLPLTKKDMKILEIITNELVIAIENVLRFEEIEQFNVTLQKKIDEATKELKQTNQKLLALDEAKDEFVSMASHQLRTPLTSIKGYLSMVLEGDAGKINDTQRDMLGQAFFSSQRMVYLISDLLNVSRLKTGKFIIEPKPTYLPNVIESEISQLQEGAAAKNLKLSFDKPKEFPTLNLDEMKIRQVVMNFTDNAIYYTPSGGKITVELKESPQSVEFSVKDNGIGVPKSEQHKLFTKFYRAENARKTRPDGTGLGIFMAKKVIVAQGGSIIFESKEGKGSTFGFSFPKDKLLVEVTSKSKEQEAK